MKSRCKEPTKTYLTLDTLKVADDFMTVPQLIAATGCTKNQVVMSLWHMKMHHAVDCFESQGQLWWFATPATDDRHKVHKDRAPEVNHRKPKKAKPRKPKGSTQ